MAQLVIGEVRVVADVPTSFASLLADEIAATRPARGVRPFRLGCSGGASGAACYRRVGELARFPYGELECFLVDERCVAAGDADHNATQLEAAFGAHFGELAGFHALDGELAEALAAALTSGGPLDLVQLGLGPDGHTASLFPRSSALHAPEELLVTHNVDPSGLNRHERVTLTYSALLAAHRRVFTVIGPDKAAAIGALFAGEALPAARLDGPGTLWLLDAAAAEGLPPGAPR
jgi:6-phosphogluconolactonase